MDQSTLKAFEAQCIQEEPPACQTGCPIHVEARSFIALLAQGKLTEARKLLDRTMPLSGLLGCLCEGPCMAVCRRAEIDEGIDLPMLERFCVSQTRQTKPFPLPGTGKTLAILGSGLSSLVVAFELSKKGHAAEVFYADEAVGGDLRGLADNILPPRRLEEAVEMLESLRVKFIPLPVADLNEEWLKSRLESSLAVYLGLDDPGLAALPATIGLNAPGLSDSSAINPEPKNLAAPADCGHEDQYAPAGPAAQVNEALCPDVGLIADAEPQPSARAAQGPIATNSVTLQTSMPRVFAGGTPGSLPRFIGAALDGRKAFLSIDRLMQGADPAVMRDKEGPYPTRLYTNLAGIEPQPKISPADPALPTADEAQAEAERCIQCQCLECVKNCAYLAHYKGYPKRYAREIYNNLAVVQGTRQANMLINSCAKCGLCARICPLDADQGAFCGLARDEMIRTDHMPASVHEFALDDMCFSNSGNIAFIRHQPGHGSSKFLFYPGCQLPASLPEESRAVYAHLVEHLSGGVGLWFGCCGSPARWGSRHALSRKTADKMRSEWEAQGKPEVILACASCLAHFKTELPEIPVRSLWEVLAELPLPTVAKAAPSELALHDPCPARDETPSLEGIRAILSTLGQPLEELSLSRNMTRCCGYGGLSAQANPVVGEAMSRDRAEDTANALLSYCVMCRDRLALVGKPSLHALNLLFPRPGSSPEAEALRPAPGISDRQHTRRLFRQKLLQELWNEDPPKDDKMDEIKLEIPDDLAPLLEKRRILHSDIKQVLLQPGSAQFQNKSTGRVLASYRPRNVTFWVEYSPLGENTYRIHNAYTHRMTVPGVPEAPRDRQALGHCCGDYGDGGFYQEKP